MIEINQLFSHQYKTVMDPVHGGIPIMHHEYLVTRHPLFQRLRHISQNDILSLVFPGATHTRYLHSLGAMHIAGRIYQSLINAYLSDMRRNPKSLSFDAQHLAAIDYFYVCLRLATLLHDCGHGPFSHQFTEIQQVKSVYADPSSFLQLWAHEDYQQFYAEPPKEITHEHVSVRAAFEILNSLLRQQPEVRDTIFDADLINDVLCLMETTEGQVSGRFQESAQLMWSLIIQASPECQHVPNEQIPGLFTKFLHQIISGEIDADKMDYLLRDSYFSGVEYGLYNLDHLINNLRAGFVHDKQDIWFGLVIHEKGLGALENFIYSRFQLYRQIYNHKTVVGFKYILLQAIQEILNDSKCLAEVTRSINDIQAFQSLTDTYFWERFQAHANQYPDSFCRRLVNASRLTHLHSDENTSDKQIAQIKKKLAASLNIPSEDIVHEQGASRFSNIKKGYKELRVLTQNALTPQLHLTPINEASDFFKKFEDVSETHFFRL